MHTARDGCTLHEPDGDLLHGFSGRFMAQKRPGASGKKKIRDIGSLFYGRATYCLTKRYAAPYVSAQMRPLVLLRSLHECAVQQVLEEEAGVHGVASGPAP